MVKNINGGNKSKRFARKDTSNVTTSILRLPSNELEHIAIVTKIYGGRLCQVLTNSNLSLRCKIRQKHSGKNKRDNNIVVNSFVLIGLYDWESTPINCDLLLCYEPQQISQISLLPQFSSLFSNLSSSSIDSHFDIFSNSHIDNTLITDNTIIDNTIIDDTVITDNTIYDTFIDDI